MEKNKYLIVETTSGVLYGVGEYMQPRELLEAIRYVGETWGKVEWESCDGVGSDRYGENHCSVRKRLRSLSEICDIAI